MTKEELEARVKELEQQRDTLLKIIAEKQTQPQIQYVPYTPPYPITYGSNETPKQTFFYDTTY